MKIDTPFKSVLTPVLRWDENQLTRNLIRMRENLAAQKKLLAQIEFEVSSQGIATLTANMEEIFQLAKAQREAEMEVMNDVLALFN